MELDRCGPLTGWPRPTVIAHCGGNTRRALAAALAAGVDWVEVDVWFHYGRLIARHDPAVWRLPITYSKRSVKVTLGPAMPLSEVLETTASSGTRVLVDLKGRSRHLPAAVVDCLRRHDALDRAALCGQDWRPLEAAAGHDPAAAIVFSLGKPRHLDAYLRRRCEGRAPAVTSCFHKLLTPESVAALKAAGVTIIAWTVDREPRARELLGWGVDAITSNDYAMLRRLVGEARG